MKSPTHRPRGRVQFGVDRILQGREALPSGTRCGLATNDAAFPASDLSTTTRVALIRFDANVVRLFSPEHGIRGGAADGTAIADEQDAKTGLPVVSLYGERLAPDPEHLAGLDLMLLDLPDVGARFYTFIWTMSRVLEACAKVGLPLWILDRPNPIGGRLGDAEGPMLDEADCASPIGRFSIPVRHSLTMGELARLWNAERGLNADLHVVPVTGWRRDDFWPATGLPFASPSPAMTDFAAALLYPGLGLFEATNLSVGRGTDKPFQQIGAPWLEGGRVCGAFDALLLPGVASHAIRFTPREDAHRAERCNGLRLSITDPKAARPVAMGLHLLACVIRCHRDRFAWSAYPTAVNPMGQLHFESLIGRTGVRENIENPRADLGALIRNWTLTEGWTERVADHLLYR